MRRGIYRGFWGNAKRKENTRKTKIGRKIILKLISEK
jgi:hypothetical protein